MLTSCVRHYNWNITFNTSHHISEMSKCWLVVWDITTVIPLSTHLTMYQRCPNFDKLCETLQLKHHCQHTSPYIRDVQMLTSCVRHYNSDTIVDTSHHVSEMPKCWLVVWDITTVIPLSTHLTMYQRCPNVDKLCETLQQWHTFQHISPCFSSVQMLTSCVRHYNRNITVNTPHHVSEMSKCWLVVWDITTEHPCQHTSLCIRDVQMLTSCVRHYNWTSLSTHLTMYQRCPNVD